MENENLATELLREVRHGTVRWFIISMVELVIIAVLVILLFVAPTEVSEDTTYAQSVEDIQDADISQTIGDMYGKSDTDSN